MSERVKLNVGCGSDFREGWVNIDGNAKLARVDLVLDLPRESLRAHFGPAAPTGRHADHVLACDFIEHHTHWEAVGLLKEFFAILVPGGTIELRLPDFEAIINDTRLSSQQKIMSLFGGQDVSQGEADTTNRRTYPQYFCHKYAYTRDSMAEELRQVGFTDVVVRPAGGNMIATARKPTAA